MKLFLDIGNSSVKWAVQEKNNFISTGTFSYKNNNFQNELQQNLIFSEKPMAVLVSNVIEKEIFELVNSWTKKQWQLECWQPKVSAHYKKLKNCYSDINQMGIDRWLAMVAAWELYSSAVCLVSCGTALTIDFIDEEGQHLGGYILPGIELMQKALVSNTVQISIDVRNNPSIEYGNDTQSSVNNGSFLAAASTINNVVDKFTKELNCELNCIISGGMAESIKPFLNNPFEHEPNLIFMGLSILHKAKQ
jgi:type III pantothenate kinase